QSAVAPLAGVSADLAPFGATLEAFVLDGGKRLRPSFCYWGYQAVADPAGLDDAVVRAAASLELLQACALVHDDVIDASDTRRGSPSVHRRFASTHRAAGWHGDPEAFGSAAAILLGDLALIWADTMLAESGVPAGDDLREGKRTVLVAFALDAANDAQRQTLRRLLGDPALDEDGVTILRDVIAATGALQRVERLIAERHDQSHRALESR